MARLAPGRTYSRLYETRPTQLSEVGPTNNISVLAVCRIGRSSPCAVAVYCGGGTLTGTWAQTWAGTWAGPHKETIFNRPSGSKVNTTYYKNQHLVLKPAQQTPKVIQFDLWLMSKPQANSTSFLSSSNFLIWFGLG